jgi:hypothetical protein
VSVHAAHRLSSSTRRHAEQRAPSGCVAPAGRWRDRLEGVVARLLAPRLERGLIAGDDPASSRLLARRAAQLATPRSRAALAHRLERLVWEAAAAPPPRRSRLTCAVPVADSEVRRAEPILRTIADRLSDERPINPVGLARVRTALVDGAGPLYTHPSSPGAVARWAQSTLRGLDDDVA